MNNTLQSVTDVLSWMGLADAIFGGVAWGVALGSLCLVACRFVRRMEDSRRNALVERLDGLATRNPALGLEVALLARRLAAQGAPSDQLFFRGIVVFLVAVLIAVGLRFLGLAPATAPERELVQYVRSSELAQLPDVRAVLSEAESGLYVTNRDVERIATAALLAAEMLRDRGSAQ